LEDDIKVIREMNGEEKEMYNQINELKDAEEKININLNELDQVRLIQRDLANQINKIEKGKCILSRKMNDDEEKEDKKQLLILWRIGENQIKKLKDENTKINKNLREIGQIRLIQKDLDDIINKIEKCKCDLSRKRFIKQIEATESMKNQFKIFESKIEEANKKIFSTQKNKFFDSMKKPKEAFCAKINRLCGCIANCCQNDSHPSKNGVIRGAEGTTISNGKTYTHTSSEENISVSTINGKIAYSKELKFSSVDKNVATVDVLEEALQFLISL